MKLTPNQNAYLIDLLETEVDCNDNPKAKELLAIMKAPRPDDAFMRAVRCDKLDDAIQVILDALALPRTASLVEAEFSAKDRDRYEKLLNCYRRGRFIETWIVEELRAAEERVGRNG